MNSARISYPDRTREDVLASLRRQVEELADRFPVEKAVLFGSYATDDFTVASDVDLLVVYRGKPRSDAYSEIRRGVDVRGLEPHPVPESEYDRRREHFDRMTEDGVVVYENQ